MSSRSISRELALLMLGQVNDRVPPADLPFDSLLQQALASLAQHVREALDNSELDLQQAQQQLLDSELVDGADHLPQVRDHLQRGLAHAEQALNRLSASLELPRLLMLADQREIREGALARTRAVLQERDALDARLDAVMEGWRLGRLPRIDRDILRLAAVDLHTFATPAPVACNEAVELANRYSDDQGRRMINGILRRLTTSIS
ncbi:transcription antitermination factor NusB [Synechococcus sp. CS-205]|uniref:transcription antitermination factor NusB n=1 Tax=Synechococcus sp. CS-205 TaxID=2847984 RepID=UPI00223A7D0E|nr:transcription antitermination factor NusB [Synechococcus sp. CS-205]MCT0248946.1 transcription antitermination factor NusB [Synechococcus sp. CS-205]